MADGAVAGSVNMSHPKVSIIVLNWNGLADTRQCIKHPTSERCIDFFSKMWYEVEVVAVILWDHS